MHYRITYLSASGYFPETNTIVKSAALTLEEAQQHFTQHGFTVAYGHPTGKDGEQPHIVFVPGTAILAIEQCDQSGYTKLDKWRMEYEQR